MRFQRLREFSRRFGLVVSFLLLCAVLSVLSDRFLTVSNMVNVLRQSTINGIIAIGMTYVILTAGIDLSVAALLALCTVVTADLLQQGLPVSLSVAAKPWAMGDWGSATPIALCGIALGVAHLTHPAHP
jgi:ribose/xylose/arabinose/galactoside ABC-type transport system permease subunit